MPKEHLLVVIRVFPDKTSRVGNFRPSKYRAYVYQITLDADGELVYRTVAKSRPFQHSRKNAEYDAIKLARKWDARMVTSKPTEISLHHVQVKLVEPQYNNVRFKSQIATLQAQEKGAE